VSNKIKLPPHWDKTVAITSNEQIPTEPKAGKAPSYAAMVKTHLSTSQGQHTADTTKKDVVSALHNTDTTIKQVQLFLAKLDKQDRIQAALISRLHKPKKPTFLKENNGILGLVLYE
jgi:hypothetical protein